MQNCQSQEIPVILKKKTLQDVNLSARYTTTGNQGTNRYETFTVMNRKVEQLYLAIS